MRRLLIVGAGRSTSSLIKYLAENASAEEWEITVSDQSLELVKEQTKGFSMIKTVAFDINNEISRLQHIRKQDLVISMLPAFMHPILARDCVGLGKHMVTASYVSDEMQNLDKDAKEQGIILMNEMGVDPGIDHMSAMKVIDEIKAEGNYIHGFETFTGGLIAPESDNNPWGYKFTWNPRNVVLAGQGVVKFIQEGTYKYIPYHRLFRRTEIITIEGYGKFEGYANRDSLSYRSKYGLDDIKTMYRGTLRKPGFCKAWNTFVQLGATDDSYVIENSENMTYREFINSFLAYKEHDSVELKLMQYLDLKQDDTEILDRLEYLDIFSHKKVGLKRATPAQILQHILEQKWTLEKEDKDMIVMWHKFDYLVNGERKEKQSSMVVIGDDSKYTAMAKTVGLPVAIATKMILNGTIQSKGVQIPTAKEIYEPVLKELESFGIQFSEKNIR